MFKVWADCNVGFFSQEVLGCDYEDLKKIIYPTPSYRAFYLKKKSGGFRVIQEPRKNLKAHQYKVLEYLKSIEGRSKPCVHGFVSSRSIVTNAKAHLEGGCPSYILNIDLADFFPSITFFRVRGVFQKAPFHFSYEVSTMLAHLCTFNGHLPQGAPTSPYLANLVCRSLDTELMSLAKRHRARYTRYADDLTFSFSVRNEARLPTSICSYDGGVVYLGEELQKIIERHSFKIQESKTRISSRHCRQEITGITINEFPNVERKFVDKIRGALHAWEVYGYENAQSRWEDMARPAAGIEGKWRRQTRVGKPPQLSNLLWGRLLYLKMVRGAEDILYTRLAERYNKLVSAVNIKAPLLPINQEVKGGDDVPRAAFVIELSGDAPVPNSSEATFVGAQGTAFAYKRADLLITCSHVFTMDAEHNGKELTVEFEDVAGAMEVTIRSPSDRREWKAELLYRDNDRDLALVKLLGDTVGLRYFTGAPSPAAQHQPCSLIGYPNWSRGRPVDSQKSIITNTFPRSALPRLDIDTIIRKGNSGGPLVDEKFRVLGVAQQGALQHAGNNECLCVTELNKWLSGLAV